MKKLLLLVAVLLVLSLNLEAQIFVIEDVIANGVTISNSTTATSGILDLSSSASSGLFPDSIYVIWDANGDTNNIELTYAKTFGVDVSSYSLIGDTITVAQEMSYAKLDYTAYTATTGLKIKYTALGSGNAVVAANKAKLTVKLRKFYTKY